MSAPTGEGASPLASPLVGRETGLRAISGVVLAALALGTNAVGGLVFAALWVGASLVILSEWIAMTGIARRRAVLGAGWLGLAGGGGGLTLGAPAVAVAGAAALGVALAVVLASGTRDRVWTLAGFGYALLVAIVPVLARDRPSGGAGLVLWMFAVVWTTDVVAYVAGRLLGGPKLWKRVSPKKTWSGALGGLVGGTAAGTMTWIAFVGGAEPSRTGILVAIGSGLASVASQAGDLAESAMKRQFGVKDSGRFIPGHGGAMDRLDGFVAVLGLLALLFVSTTLAGVASAGVR